MIDICSILVDKIRRIYKFIEL